MKLIKNKEVIEEKPQEATALALANARMKEVVSGPVYTLRVEDPSEKTGVATYLLLKQVREENSILCDFFGFKAGKTQINAINSFEDVVNYVEKGSVKVVNMRVPWTKIVSIENITYKHKNRS